MKYLLPIKALSVNEAYRGRRFSTRELLQYKKDLSRILPRIEIPDGNLAVTYAFGVSSKAADGDNLIKAFQDVLGEHYGFNDKRIYEWRVTKYDVARGDEFIQFSIEPLCPNQDVESGRVFLASAR